LQDGALAGKLAEWYSPHVPFYVGAGAVCLASLVLFSGRHAVQARVHLATLEDISEGEAIATA
jgi:hypothetical protein